MEQVQRETSHRIDGLRVDIERLLEQLPALPCRLHGFGPVIGGPSPHLQVTRVRISGPPPLAPARRRLDELQVERPR